MAGFFNQLLQILIYGGILQGVFIVLLLNNKGVRKGRANFFLSVLLLALSFSIAHILFAGEVITHLSAEIYSIGDPTFYLIAPLLWFYARELFAFLSDYHFLSFFSISQFRYVSFFTGTPTSVHHHTVLDYDCRSGFMVPGISAQAMACLSNTHRTGRIF